MKILSWNINGIKTSLPYVCKLLTKEDPDILFLSEIKVGEKVLANLLQKPAGDLDKLDQYVIPSTYTSFWNPNKKPGSHGTAMFVKTVHDPVLIAKGLERPKDEDRSVLVDGLCARRPVFPKEDILKAHMTEGRLLAVHLKAKDLVVVGTYVPNVGEPPAMPRLGYRVRQWDPDLALVLRSYMETYGDRLVWCGDLNVAQHPIDVYDPIKQRGKGCFTVEERGCFTEMCKRLCLTDTYRHLHPKSQDFSFYSFRFASVSTCRGWRLDYVMASEPMTKALESSFILENIDGELESPIVESGKNAGRPKRISDHLPVGAIFDI